LIGRNTSGVLSSSSFVRSRLSHNVQSFPVTICTNNRRAKNIIFLHERAFITLDYLLSVVTWT